MAFDPFGNNDNSFEQGNPLTSAAKTVVSTAGTQTVAKAKVLRQDVVNQLYGVPTAQEQGADSTDPQAGTNTNASHSAAAQSGKSGGTNTAQSPDDQANMQKIRHELFANYGSKFRTAQNGPFGVTTNLEQEIEKARQEREQKEMQRKKEEEEEERRKKEEEERQKQSLEMPTGKKTGAMYGKKQQQPVALRLATTKTESNRGASG